MPRVKVDFLITSGPQHWFDLVICLGEPEPRPLYGYGAGGHRSPGFQVKTGSLYKRFPKPINGRLEAIVNRISSCGAYVPVMITSLTRDKRDNYRWVFKGMTMRKYARDFSFPVSGWFNIKEQKGRLTVWESKEDDG